MSSTESTDRLTGRNLSLFCKDNTQNRKENNDLLYINNNSNHPPNVKKDIPRNVNRMLSQLSSSQEEFDEVVNLYQAALDGCGYSHKLVFGEIGNEMSYFVTKLRSQLQMIPKCPA